MAKILLIDDDVNVQLLLKGFLEMHGHELCWAKDGAFGVSSSIIENPDLIILDVEMPVMGGEHTMEFLKAEPSLAGIPVVALSAQTDEKIKQSMLDAGCVTYIQKPFDLLQFEKCIEGVLTFRSKPS